VAASGGVSVAAEATEGGVGIGAIMQMGGAISGAALSMLMHTMLESRMPLDLCALCTGNGLLFARRWHGFGACFCCFSRQTTNATSTTWLPSPAAAAPTPATSRHMTPALLRRDPRTEA
jgi:hypothetical protein